MKLYRTAKWYNPFSVEVSGKGYMINSISIFHDGERIAYSGQGWFGHSNNFDELEIDCECVLKRKIDLNCKTAFIVKAADTYEVRYDLYIPDSAVLLSDPTYKFNSSDNRHIIKTQKSLIIDGIIFEKFIFTDKDITSIESKIREIGKKIELSFGSDFDKIESYTKELTELVLERNVKLTKLKNATVEELAKEYEDK